MKSTAGRARSESVPMSIMSRQCARRDRQSFGMARISRRIVTNLDFGIRAFWEIWANAVGARRDLGAHIRAIIVITFALTVIVTTSASSASASGDLERVSGISVFLSLSTFGSAVMILFVAKSSQNDQDHNHNDDQNYNLFESHFILR